jgi:hypothetical protein
MTHAGLRRTTAALAATLMLASAGLAGCTSRTGGEVPEPTVEMPLRTQQVSVYLPTGRSLTQEYRIVDADNLYESTLTQLMTGESDNPELALVQPVSDFRSVTLEDGVLTIDWDRAILDFEADPEEYTIAWGSFILTFGQFPEVEKLVFTVEGQTDGEIDGKDVENFWGQVTLADQPWDIQRPPGYEDPDAAEEETSTPGPMPEDEITE